MGGDSGNRWWVDDPIKSLGADLLDRIVFVEGVQDLIERVGGSPASTVIGLVGPWGSGKTSTVNMIVNGLDRTSWGIAQITPWAVTGAEAVISELLAGIVAALPAGRNARRVRKAMKSYGAFVTPLLSAVPVVGGTAKGMADAALARSNAGTLQQQTDKVAGQLRKLARPVLVVVDDIDRLQHEELLAVFRGVRVLGRLPHVHYLLAYDEQTVLDVLQATEIANNSRPRAFAFLEKIVSLRLDQPPTRAEQADVMLARGLDEVIEEHTGGGLTESQRVRLDDERQALLSAILTEPRAIQRFLTQLRTYLPIMGSSEVDFVDYAVITLFRLTYPSLFRALAHDRAVLVGTSTRDDNHQLAEWKSGEKLNDCDVPQRHVDRVGSAVHRLFPRTAQGGTASYILTGDKFRKDRRATSADYVDKYFALTAPTIELADAVIAEALHEWTTGEPADADTAFSDALVPPSSDKAACAQAARLIRRAASYSEELDSTDAAAVLRVLLSRLPMTPNGGIESAASVWIATLLTRAPAIDPSEVLQLLERQPEQASPLHYLLRATRLTTAHSGADQQWFSELVNQATAVAWNRFATHARLADSAPVEPVGQLLNWLEETVGPAAVREQLASVIDGGLSLPDVAARMLEVRADAAGEYTQLMPVDLDLFVLRFGSPRILQHLGDLRAAATTATQPIDLRDLSWSNRKAVAASHLGSAAAQDALVRIPDLEVVDTPPSLQNHEPDLISRARPGQDPDLKVQLTVLVPNGSAAPSLGELPNGPLDEERESAALRLLEEAPITSWLTRVGESWHLACSDWRISDAQTGSSTSAILKVHLDHAGSDPKPQLPLAVGAQLRTGLDQASADPVRPALLLTVVVGFWLMELRGDRRPDNIRHAQARPLPASLSLSELIDLLAALVASVGMAFEAFGHLVRDATQPVDATVDLTLHTKGGLGVIIDLREVQAVRDANRVDHRVTTRVRRPSATYDERAFGQATAIVDRWLRGAGYREHETKLLSILGSRDT